VRWFSNARPVLRALAPLCLALLAPHAGAHHGDAEQHAREQNAMQSGEQRPHAPPRFDELSAEFRALRLQVARSLVKIEAVKQGGGYSLGTGVVVAPRKVVTNCHVTREAARISVLWGGLRYGVRAQNVDAQRDLCVLHVPRLDVAAAPFAPAQTKARAGQLTLAAGFVGGQGLQVAQGEVVALHDFDGGRVIQTTTAFTSGASGGGLFNAQGELLGILTFRLRGANAHYFAVPAQWISGALMDDARAAKVAPIEGIAFWYAQGAALPFFLQAAPLEAGKQWEALVRLSERWASAEAGNAEAWFVRAQAYAQLKRSDAAIKALRKAVEVDPNYELAWYQLGLAHAEDCEHAEFKRIAAVLERLDQPLSARLQQAALASGEQRNKSFAC
jgi:serine protease Do